MTKASAIMLAAVALLAGGCGGGDGGGEGEGEAAATTEERKTLDPAQTHSVTFQTNKGSFTVELDVETSPKTTASFYELAQKGFFDGTTFHRIVPGFVIQGGDPTGTGTGGPGYQTVDPPPSEAAYTKGVVAMAKAQDEAPGTAGSQFFVVTGEDIGLPPEYAILGKVTAGLGVVERIGRLGDSATEQPTERIVIEKATAETQ